MSLILVSERKPVGTTRTDKDTVVDLIGEDPTPAAAPSGPSTHDLLADIFGGEPSAPAASQTPARSANDDIMSLFGGSSMQSQQPSQPTPAPAPAPAPIPTAPQQASAPQLQSYPAYDKNSLKITLTPRPSPTQPGMVQILAKFTASETISNVNLQVAVPKVRTGS